MRLIRAGEIRYDPGTAKTLIQGKSFRC